MNHVKTDLEDEVIPIFKKHGKTQFGMLLINDLTLKVHTFHLENALLYSERNNIPLERVWSILAKVTNDIRNKYMNNPRQIP